MRAASTRHVWSLAIAIACWLTAPARAQEPNANLRGVVTGEKGEPLAGATVGIPSLEVYAFADERGQYLLNLPPGTYTLRSEAVGHRAVEKTVVVGEAPSVVDLRMQEDLLGEVIVITGSRTPRSRLETSVPVDVISSDVLAEASQTETNQILNTVAPSFNATHLSINDGTDHIDPATLRGLGPEHVLVLVNGRRLHQSSLVNVYNGGTVGIDLNAIPTAAIARIEVLRDGAASQYGSDAIAGVINIVLKDSVDLLDVYAMTGVTASSDGAQLKLGANTGWKLGKRGFVNATLELFGRGRTNRSDAWSGDIFPGIEGTADTDAELARRGLTREDFSMQVGDSGALVGTTFLNAGYKLDDTFEVHAHGGYTLRKGYASGFFRFPSSEDRVDLDVYPNGFLPEINPRLQAWTATAGIRGKKNKWEGDLSLTHGGDTIRFYIDNTINASFGASSPTSFNAGRLMFHQTSLNFDAVRRISLAPLKSLSAVMGAELRNDNYNIRAGQYESYALGPEVTSDGTPKAAGSQVFPGFRPADARSENRQSAAAYAGVESQPTARTNLDLGARFEQYSDFGSTLTGKVAGRVAVLKTDDNEVAVRGAVSTGFRAPGLQQIWYSTIATNFVTDAGTGETVPIDVLISPNRSAVTKGFGVPDLKEETSVHASGGFTARLFGAVSLSADYYHVTIKDRVVLSGLFSADADIIGPEVGTILDGFPGVGGAQFFVNAVDTTTDGVDVVVDYARRIPNGVLKATAAANFTRTKVDAVNVPASMKQRFDTVEGGADQVASLFLGRYGKGRIEDLLPRRKGTAAVRADIGSWSAGLRANYFGPTEYHSDYTTDEDSLDESFGAKVTLDVDIGYRIGGVALSIGANNVLNTFPDELQREGNRNNGTFIYSPADASAGAPYGTEGGFYYLRAEYKR